MWAAIEDLDAGLVDGPPPRCPATSLTSWITACQKGISDRSSRRWTPWAAALGRRHRWLPSPLPAQTEGQRRIAAPGPINGGGPSGRGGSGDAAAEMARCEVPDERGLERPGRPSKTDTRPRACRREVRDRFLTGVPSVRGWLPMPRRRLLPAVRPPTTPEPSCRRLSRCRGQRLRGSDDSPRHRADEVGHEEARNRDPARGDRPVGAGCVISPVKPPEERREKSALCSMTRSVAMSPRSLGPGLVRPDDRRCGEVRQAVLVAVAVDRYAVPRPLVHAGCSTGARSDRRRVDPRLAGATPAGERAATTENSPSTRRLPADPAPRDERPGLPSRPHAMRRGDHRVTRTAAGSLRPATRVGVDSPGSRRPEGVGRSCLLEGTASCKRPGTAPPQRLSPGGRDLASVARSSPPTRRTQ